MKDFRRRWLRSALPALGLFALSCAVFTLLVKNIKAKKLENVKGLEALGADD